LPYAPFIPRPEEAWVFWRKEIKDIMKKLSRKLHDWRIEFATWLLSRVTFWWAERFMDQWEQFCFDTEYGRVYVTMSRYSDYPDSFDLINKNGRPLPQPDRFKSR
jgi:hypothetical protein